MSRNTLSLSLLAGERGHGLMIQRPQDGTWGDNERLRVCLSRKSSQLAASLSTGNAIPVRDGKW